MALAPGGSGAGPALLMRAQLTVERQRDTVRPSVARAVGSHRGLHLTLVLVRPDAGRSLIGRLVEKACRF
jgi:hypothetical protein